MELADAEGSVAVTTAARAVILAVLSNTIVKGGNALTVGARTLRLSLLPPLVAMLIAAGAAAFLLI